MAVCAGPYFSKIRSMTSSLRSCGKSTSMSGSLLQRHAVLVQEAAEVEIEADGANAADVQAIAGERIGRAAARDPFDAAAAAFLQDVPHDQEIFLVADLGDDGQFLLELRSEAGVLFRVAALKPFHDEPAQESRRRGAVRGRVAGELRFAEGEGERAAVGDLAAVREQLGMRGKELPHFGWRPEMVFAVQALLGMRLAQERERADALHDVVLPAVGGQFVVDGERSDAGQGSGSAFRRRRGCSLPSRSGRGRTGRVRRRD